MLAHQQGCPLIRPASIAMLMHPPAHVSLLSRSLVHSAQQMYTVAVDDAVAQAAAAATTVAANGADSSQNGGTFGFLADGFEAFLKVRAHMLASAAAGGLPQLGLRGTGQARLAIWCACDPVAAVVPQTQQPQQQPCGSCVAWSAAVSLCSESPALPHCLQVLEGGLARAGVPYSYGFAIILLTVLVKVATYPLTKKSVSVVSCKHWASPRLVVVQSCPAASRHAPAEAVLSDSSSREQQGGSAPPVLPHTQVDA